MEGCVFCAIVGGRAPAHRLLEDEHTVSFLNIAPATVGHALVVPRYRADELQVMWQATPVADGGLAALRARVLRQDDRCLTTLSATDARRRPRRHGWTVEVSS